MKFYVSYRYTGEDKNFLRKNLEYLSSLIKKNNHKDFIFFRDLEEWGEKNIDSKKIISSIIFEIKKKRFSFDFFIKQRKK